MPNAIEQNFQNLPKTDKKLNYSIKPIPSLLPYLLYHFYSILPVQLRNYSSTSLGL